PATVKALLAARIDRLAPEEKAVLQAAAVIGTNVPFGLLQATAEMSEEQLRPHLGRLQSAEFLYETNLFPELEYTFKHALMHEVAYGGLLHERRRELHGRVVDTIERIYSGCLPEHVDSLAYHAFRSELWEKAVTYLHQSGTKASRRSAYPQAVASFEQALAALVNLPETQTRTERELGLQIALAIALQATRGYAAPDVERVFMRARELCN